MLIHVDSLILYQTAAELDTGLMDVWERLAELRRQINLLEMNWYGSAKPEAYGEDFRHMLERLDAQAEELNQLCGLLRRQAVAWEECDQEWANKLETLARY